MPSANLTTEYSTVSVSDLRLHPDNPRRGDPQAIAASLRHHGQYKPLVVNRHTMEVL